MLCLYLYYYDLSDKLYLYSYYYDLSNNKSNTFKASMIN